MDREYDGKKSLREQLSEARAGYRAKKARAKAEYEKKKADIKSAQKIGYTGGVMDYQRLPKRKEALQSAKRSYASAIDDSAKIDRLKDKQRKKMNH